MASTNINCVVSVKDVEPIKTILNRTGDLLAQINKSNFTDENGMQLKDNISYLKLVEVLEEIGICTK